MRWMARNAARAVIIEVVFGPTGLEKPPKDLLSDSNYVVGGQKSSQSFGAYVRGSYGIRTTLLRHELPTPRNPTPIPALTPP